MNEKDKLFSIEEKDEAIFFFVCSKENFLENKETKLKFYNKWVFKINDNMC